MSGLENHLNLAGVAAAIDAATERAARLGAEHVLTESRALVPHEEGTLERSGKVTADGTTAAVSYDTPYAVRQHEDLNLRHDDGRTAKYLERPLHEQADTVAAIAAQQLREALS